MRSTAAPASAASSSPSVAWVPSIRLDRTASRRANGRGGRGGVGRGGPPPPPAPPPPGPAPAYRVRGRGGPDQGGDPGDGGGEGVRHKGGVAPGAGDVTAFVP